ncbi:lactose/cellobiose PTS transporter subunit IIB [Companilactobacillus nantensis]|uniref:PTS system lactose-specific EIICB component n=1 Tax=Companilactobacillus nantensis DSM 16982 TaxID=1423774 RepID=A0A0R1WRA8_9LACO|nr:lactose/cellobiose PTS transporter subunit IIB [Companilactobacillus nantensis]KRM18265.1 cellobiose-specific PTS system IIC component [Companilactobacillus nantensis DSM 16982]GEO62929.1 PTS lactose transporter subunit IIBC [Companilactobacillus nantensis]
MNTIVKQIEKAQPFFKKLSANIYLQAVRDGFISLMPIIIFSSLFILVSAVPNIWGFYWPTNVNDGLMKIYNYSMGVLSLMAAANVARALTKSLNLRLPKINQIPTASVMFASQIAFLLVAVDPFTNKLGLYFTEGYMGTKGLLAAFLVGFIVPNLYYFCFKNHITIKMPDQVPQNISSAFANIIPFALSTSFFGLFDVFFRMATGTNLAAWIIQVLAPLFTAADGYFGLAIVYGAMAFFWFIGIQGPSIVEPAVTAIYLTNVETNMKVFQAGGHATNILAQGTQYFVATLGGTGATLVITYMFALWAKSKELKAVGRAAAIPVTFGVNEPILFGAPLILNPVFFIPFIGAPILNVWLFKIFVDHFGMNGFIYNLPWTTPGPIGLYMGVGFSIQALILVVALLAMDTVVYYPFFKAYDMQKVAEEAEKDQVASVEGSSDDSSNVATDAVVATAAGDIPLGLTKDKKNLNILVICAGGGTSGILANALNKMAKEKDLPVEAAAAAYGAHSDLLPDMDVTVLAPQMDAMKDSLKQEADKSDVKMITTTGKQYIDLTRHADKALSFIIDKLQNNENKDEGDTK